MDIVHEFIARTTPDVVYRALTEQSGLAAWFTPDTQAEPLVGSTITFGFDNGARLIRVEVAALEPERNVSWSVVQGFPGWGGVTGAITWTLTPTEWGTLLHFRHSGWRGDEEAFPSNNFKWAFFLMQLKTYVETSA